MVQCLHPGLCPGLAIKEYATCHFNTTPPIRLITGFSSDMAAIGIQNRKMRELTRKIGVCAASAPVELVFPPGISAPQRTALPGVSITASGSEPDVLALRIVLRTKWPG